MNTAFKVAANIVEDLSSCTDPKPGEQQNCLLKVYCRCLNKGWYFFLVYTGREGISLPNSTTWQDWLKIRQVS
jgi:hypothetical protein